MHNSYSWINMVRDATVLSVHLFSVPFCNYRVTFTRVTNRTLGSEGLPLVRLKLLKDYQVIIYFKLTLKCSSIKRYLL